MATSHPADKYAFLFSGPIAPVPLFDLQNVFNLLTRYYNYPPGHITVAVGVAPAPALPFPGALIVSANTPPALNAALGAFAAAASGPNKTALLYFTGGGSTVGGHSVLLLDGGLPVAGNIVGPGWLAPRVAAVLAGDVHLVMQQSRADGFAADFAAAGMPHYSFTAACDAGEDSLGGLATGGFFTEAWCRGLRLEPLPAGAAHAGQYADTLGALVDASDRLVELDEAAQFAVEDLDAQGLGGFMTPGFHAVGVTQLLGEPAFLIRDSVAPWWESPDIWLTHPNHPAVPPGDWYIPDAVGAVAPFNNTINVRVRNIGTHPVRLYSLGVEQFRSGAGMTNLQLPICDRVPEVGVAPAVTHVLLPMLPAEIGDPAEDHSDLYTLNVAFTEGVTHSCVRAKALRVCAGLDFAFAVQAHDWEAQRNTDPMPLAPPPPAPLPALAEIQGAKAHVIALQNRFKEAQRFVLPVAKEFDAAKELLRIEWLARTEGPQGKWGPLKLEQEPRPHYRFALKPEQVQEVMVRVALRPGVKPERIKNLRLPIVVLADGDWEDARPPEDKAWRGFAAIAGVTLEVTIGRVTLRGVVVDRAGKPVAKTPVYLQTVNGLARGRVLTGRGGEFEFRDINPDIYDAWAPGRLLKCRKTRLVLLDGVEKVKLVLGGE